MNTARPILAKVLVTSATSRLGMKAKSPKASLTQGRPVALA
ncbi:MAG: hypothetical protein N3H31_06715 [Candidatus Nezhaarchaeota archaeon]|nr:hypothetical protein [Candidatus Nezhaarchaeota archaeon]